MIILYIVLISYFELRHNSAAYRITCYHYGLRKTINAPKGFNSSSG